METPETQFDMADQWEITQYIIYTNTKAVHYGMTHVIMK